MTPDSVGACAETRAPISVKVPLQYSDGERARSAMNKKTHESMEARTQTSRRRWIPAVHLCADSAHAWAMIMPMITTITMLYARVLFFCEVNNNKNAKEYLCFGLL